MTATQGIENTVLRGFTLRNMIVTITCTASIIFTVVTTYQAQQKENAIMDLRLKVLEAQITVLNQRVDAVQHGQK